MLGERWPRKAWGGTDWKALNGEAKRRLEACELKLDPGALCHTLSPAQRQEVAIARSLAQNAKLLILDEPTASLTEPEVERLFAHLAKLRERGVALLYVSHRLDEILKLTNRVVVLRDGQLVAEYVTSEATIPRLVQGMVGRELATGARKERRIAGGLKTPRPQARPLRPSNTGTGSAKTGCHGSRLELRW